MAEALLNEFLDALLESWACQLIGFTVATTIYGITVLQTYLYFERYGSDKVYIKLTVAALFLLDTLATLLVAHSLYTEFILRFRNPIENLHLTWSFSLENGIATVIVIIVQCYFAHCLWRFSNKNRWLIGGIVFFALSSFALGIQTTVHIFQNSFGTVLSARETLIIGGLVQGLAAMCDVLITGGLCYYLQKGRSGIKVTDRLVDRLMKYAIQRGALTTLIQILFLVTNVALPGHQYWIPFHLVVSKLYVNSVLATLNVRTTLASGANDVELYQTSIMFNNDRQTAIEGSLSAAGTESRTLPEPVNHSLSTLKEVTPEDLYDERLSTKPRLLSV
ncbi:hypothetical protein PYCCODRAFT_1435649 [Trametes coccinea BRFM310]|uniref:DUF6534 domain-containing protein n=1 Tax=Trametes coccinea (strain BRFM310) TaxID=1353009 RepID=A0A1Y2INW2_TRAC3|nr:hypothetical protein PYCCODRAFT_1435649 [Trametes coccinea BRFM310]